MAIPTAKVSHKVSKILFSWCACIPFLEKYEWTKGPRYLLRNIIFTPLRLERIYRNMASSSHGVVGSTGRKTPMNPIATQNDAADIYRYFPIFLLYSQR